MQLRTKYKTNTKSCNDGSWIEFNDFPNNDAVYEEDGTTLKTPATIPAFRMARKSSHNAKYAQTMREVTKEVNTADGVKQLDELTEEESEQVELDVFVSTLLIDWRNFQPDEDGVSVDYNEKKAREIFGNPDWRDLRTTLSIMAGQAANYAYKKKEAETKN